MKVGDSASFQTKITSDLVDEFAEFSGDFNPIHISDEYSINAGFGGRVAHGVIALSLVSALLGCICRAGSLWTKHSLAFTAPVRIGDTLLVYGTVERSKSCA